MVDFSPATDKNVVFRDSETHSPAHEPAPPAAGPRKILKALYVSAVILLLFLNYFLAQFDKFVLSYFQSEVLESLQLTSTQYGILSGYAVGILYAVLAIPMAYIADYTEARVWVLSVAALWWSLCVLFQGYSHNFWQILLARIGMGIGQSPVEALSISLISDLVPLNWIFVCERYVAQSFNCLRYSVDCNSTASSTSVSMLAKRSAVRSPLPLTKQILLGVTP